MINKLKGILATTAIVIAAFYVWGLLAHNNPNPMGALMTGGIAGIISGAAIAFIRNGAAPRLVGMCTMLVLWGIVAALMISSFGTSGLDVTKVLITTMAMAAIGALGGQSYKFISAKSSDESIGD